VAPLQTIGCVGEQIVVSLVEHDRVRLQAPIIANRVGERIRPLRVEPEVGDSDAFAASAQHALDLRRQRFLRAHAVPEDRAAAEDRDPPLPRLARTEHRPPVAAPVHARRAGRAVVGPEIGGDERRHRDAAGQSNDGEGEHRSAGAR